MKEGSFTTWAGHPLRLGSYLPPETGMLTLEAVSLDGYLLKRRLPGWVVLPVHSNKNILNAAKLLPLKTLTYYIIYIFHHFKREMFSKYLKDMPGKMLLKDLYTSQRGRETNL